MTNLEFILSTVEPGYHAAQAPPDTDLGQRVPDPTTTPSGKARKVPLALSSTPGRCLCGLPVYRGLGRCQGCRRQATAAWRKRVRCVICLTRVQSCGDRCSRRCCR